ncbi:cytosine permease [Novosphingobium resinovorum]
MPERATACLSRYWCGPPSAPWGAASALARALVACGWYGIQTWIGGEALLTLLGIFLGADLRGRRCRSSGSGWASCWPSWPSGWCSCCSCARGC